MGTDAASAIIFVLIKLASVTAHADELFTLLPDASTQGIAECERMTDIEFCTETEIDFEVLNEKSDFLMEGVVFHHSYSRHNQDSTTTYSYETDNLGSAVFLYSEANGYPEVDGSLLFDGSGYRIDNCGAECHVLVKFGWNMLNPEPEEELFGPVIDEQELDPGTSSLRGQEFVSSQKLVYHVWMDIKGCICLLR